MRGHLKTVNGQEYGFGDDGSPIECFRCGICCVVYQPKVTMEEIESMAEQLSVTTDEFITGYVMVTQIGYLLRQTENGCVFLAREKGSSKASCDIYSFRPAPCRDWVPGLSRPECQEGLVKLQRDNEILPVGEVYQTQAQIEKLCALLRQS